MDVNIQILVENTTPVPGLIGEYGFACLIKAGGNSILFDTGSAEALFVNSQALGVKLDEIKYLILSHGHFDHTGALLPLLKRYGPKNVYAHPQVFVSRPLPIGNGNFKEIGCPCSQKEIIAFGAEIKLFNSFTEVLPAIYISGEIPRITDYEDVGGNFKVRLNGEIKDDELPDDMAVIINHPQGLIIISGCAHAGIINTIQHAIKMTGRDKILAYIGGTHLMTASESRLDETIAALKTYKIEKMIMAHCTGFYAAARLYNELGSSVIKAETGMSFNF